MNYRIKTKTAPEEMAVKIEDARSHCRIFGEDEDNLLRIYIRAAQDLAENETRRTFVDTTFTMYLDAFPYCDYFVLPKSPIIAVSSIKYYDSDGNLQTLSSDDYEVDTTDDLKARVVLSDSASWPNTDVRINAVEVEFRAGYLDPGGTILCVPTNAQLAILLMVSHYMENRDEVTPVQLKTIPKGANALLSSIKLNEIADDGDKW